MSRIALHPESFIKHSVIEWELKYKNVDIKPLCVICRKPMYVRASGTPGSDPHFVHYHKSNCPSIDENRKKYASLKPTEKDAANAKKIKKELMNNMWAIYQKCRELCGGDLRQQQFKEMVNKATENDIWFYKGMSLKYLPYVLVVNYGVFHASKRKFYFVFDSKLSNYDDLWINGKLKQKIWKVYYEDNDLEELEISYDTSKLAPEFFLFYITDLQKGNKEDEFLNW